MSDSVGDHDDSQRRQLRETRLVVGGAVLAAATFYLLGLILLWPFGSGSTGGWEVSFGEVERFGPHVTIEVELTNVSGDSMRPSPRHFFLQTPGGHESGPTDWIGFPERLATGGSVQVWMSFEDLDLHFDEDPTLDGYAVKFDPPGQGSIEHDLDLSD